MKRIETEVWEPVPEDPRTIRYVKPRTAGEVFTELKHRLEITGFLPDEYLLMDSLWENGVEMPRDVNIFCTVDYGASEGIYLDIYMKYYDEKQKKNVTTSFATGKTLGESALDLDRMNLIASAVTKAFHSDGVHARYIRLGTPDKAAGCIVHLNAAEQRLLIDSLVEKHDRLKNETQAVEKLLRRVTGSITEYINEIGIRPMNLSYFDEAVLAVHDGNMAAFNKSYRHVSEELGELLVHAAGRPGSVGRQMTALILAASSELPEDIYLEACKRAIDTGDADRVNLMATHADSVGMEPSTRGEMMYYALSEGKRHIARALLDNGTYEHIKAANPQLLVKALSQQDYHMAAKLVAGGINGNDCAAEIIRALVSNTNDRDFFGHLMNLGLKVAKNNYSAMQACIRTDSPNQAKLLLDNGMDFDLYNEWANNERYAVKAGETYDAVKEYWENVVKQAEPEMAEDGRDSGITMAGM